LGPEQKRGFGSNNVWESVREGDATAARRALPSLSERFGGKAPPLASRICWKKLSASAVVVNKKLRRVSTVGAMNS